MARYDDALGEASRWLRLPLKSIRVGGPSKTICECGPYKKHMAAPTNIYRCAVTHVFASASRSRRPRSCARQGRSAWSDPDCPYCGTPWINLPSPCCQERHLPTSRFPWRPHEWEGPAANHLTPASTLAGLGLAFFARIDADPSYKNHMAVRPNGY